MIAAKILDIFHAHDELSLIDAIEEYSFRYCVTTEEIVDSISDDSIFKELLAKDLIRCKYLKEDKEYNLVDHLDEWSNIS